MLLLAAAFAAIPAAAQSRDPVSQLIDRIVANEQQFVARLKPLHPILETYLQETADGADPDSPPAADHYMIGRLDLSSSIGYTPFLASAAFQKRGGFLPFRKGGSSLLSSAGFAQMVVMDLDEFNRETYDFEYLRREFLGDVRCLVFNIAPKNKKDPGKFIGRIWAEDKEYRVVRFNGTYTLSKTSAVFFHFDSWRVNVAPGVWAPAAIYIEDSNPIAPGGKRARFKGQSRLWGYSAVNSSKLEELTSILVEAETPVREQAASKDVLPIESQRSWKRQAEENIIHRLEKSSLLAPQGDVEQVLNTVISNLLVTNNMSLDVDCRVLLTTPLETISIGHTIVISRGLLDVLPDEASLAVVLSDELAHIALGHRVETMYAFSDETMFDDKDTLSRLRLSRTPQEIEAAGRKAMEMLSNSPYKDKLANAGLFLKALAGRAGRLPQLIQANLGNGLANESNLLHLGALASQAPPLDESKMEQIAALPLGSRIKLDPWTNQITLIKTKPVALLSAREKMPFEVTPLSLYLTRVPAAPESSGR